MYINELIKDVNLIAALDELEIKELTEIQEKAIPVMLAKKDIIGLAQTGTGKTFAFGLPLIENLLYNGSIEGLIICPTRELAIQVANELKKVLKYKKKLKIATIYGGESYDIQIKELKSKPQIVVGTPGRIVDHLNRKTLKIDNLNTLILDEADEMLKMGFKEDLEFILDAVKSVHQTALFSATMAPFIKEVAKKYLNDPEIIEIKKKTLTVEAIEQKLYYVKREQKRDLLIRLLDFYRFNSLIIFANTKAMVDELQTFLIKHNYKADSLHGDLKQAQRDKVMTSFKKGTLNILVCTDVAARGIDVKGLEAIINYDLPQEDELYVHRIGRTGRAGAKGLSLSLATKSERHKVGMIEAYTKQKMQLAEVPTREAIEGNLLDNLYQEIENNLGKSIKPNLKIINKLASKELDPADIINSLIEIILKDKRKKYSIIDEVTFNTVKKRNNAKERSYNTNRKNHHDGHKNKDKYKHHEGKRRGKR